MEEKEITYEAKPYDLRFCLTRDAAKRVNDFMNGIELFRKKPGWNETRRGERNARYIRIESEGKVKR